MELTSEDREQMRMDVLWRESLDTAEYFLGNANGEPDAKARYEAALAAEEAALAAVDDEELTRLWLSQDPWERPWHYRLGREDWRTDGLRPEGPYCKELERVVTAVAARHGVRTGAGAALDLRRPPFLPLRIRFMPGPSGDVLVAHFDPVDGRIRFDLGLLVRRLPGGWVPTGWVDEEGPRTCCVSWNGGGVEVEDADAHARMVHFAEVWAEALEARYLRADAAVARVSGPHGIIIPVVGLAVSDRVSDNAAAIAS